MSNNFAPYQDSAPDVTRSLSPPPKSPPPKSPSPRVPVVQPQNINFTRAISPPTSPSYQNNQDYLNFPSTESIESGVGHGGPRDGGDRFWSSRSGIDLYETSLGMRLDWEACLAYIGLPPAGAAVLLMFEHRSDYVRFHAWQSALLFSVLFVVHILFSWSSFISWLIFVGDVFLIGLLTLRAYKDAETLDRFEVPIFGPLASSILDDE